MVKRGRKSAAELSIVALNPITRPDPPGDITASQKKIWKSVVDGEPIDFFQTAALQDMLKNLVRHQDTANRVSGVVEEFDIGWIKSDDGEKKFANLLRLRDREASAASSLATKLRVTNQSRYTPKAAGTAARNETKLKKPWEA